MGKPYGNDLSVFALWTWIFGEHRRVRDIGKICETSRNPEVLTGPPLPIPPPGLPAGGPNLRSLIADRRDGASTSTSAVSCADSVGKTRASCGITRRSSSGCTRRMLTRTREVTGRRAHLNPQSTQIPSKPAQTTCATRFSGLLGRPMNESSVKFILC